MAVVRNVLVTVDGHEIQAAEADPEKGYAIVHYPLVHAISEPVGDFERRLDTYVIAWAQQHGMPLANVYKLTGAVQIVLDTSGRVLHQSAPKTGATEAELRVALQALLVRGREQADLTLKFIDYVRKRFDWDGKIETDDLDDHKQTATLFGAALVLAKETLDR